MIVLLTIKDAILNLFTFGWYGRHEGAKSSYVRNAKLRRFP